MSLYLPEWVSYAATWLCGATVGIGALFLVAIIQSVQSKRKEKRS